MDGLKQELKSLKVGALGPLYGCYLQNQNMAVGLIPERLISSNMSDMIWTSFISLCILKRITIPFKHKKQPPRKYKSLPSNSTCIAWTGLPTTSKALSMT